MIVHLGVDLCCANDLGVCSGRQRQTFNNWTHDVCHDSSESVFNTDCNGMRHFIEDNGVRERWIFFHHIPSLVCDVPITFTAVLKSQVPNDLKSKQKTWERPPKNDGNQVSYDYTSR